MNFTDWYDVEENANVLIVKKDETNIEKYKNEKYDYIFLDGILENANQIINSNNPEKDLILFFKDLLNNKGVLIIAVDNKLGVKNLVGNKSEHCKKIYDSLKNKYIKGKMFSKKELDNIIENLEFETKKYYYPLPNYKMPNIIFTDDMLPSENDSKINYNVIYDEGSLVVQDEVRLLKTLIQEGQFVNFTNSYIIELSNNRLKNDVKYYSINNMRKDKYSLILKIKGEYVEKYACSDEAILHINNIKESSKKLKELGFSIAEEENKGNFIKSKFINLESLDKQIVRKIKENSLQDAYNLIDNWYEYISKKLNIDENGLVENGFIDLVFENTFYNPTTNEYIFFDQEWFKKNIECKFILYRAINNLYEHNPSIDKKIQRNEIIKKYNIDEQIYIEEEKKIQDEVIDNKKRKFYEKQYEYKISSEDILEIIENVKKLDKDNVELIKENERLSKLYEKQNLEIAKIKNSRTWKCITKIRKIFK